MFSTKARTTFRALMVVALFLTGAVGIETLQKDSVKPVQLAEIDPPFSGYTVE